ncbi:MAG: glycosyltransferase [Bacillus sp. (in: Bacteria)]|nr:glycosyltransferase [Bacillus sp. (in: firmicutes)]
MLISIIMSVYNGEKYLQEAVDSVLAQTYTNIELIIVNDGSTDSTKSILNTIKDKRARVIHFKKNRGAAQALNLGIHKAHGEWIAINDADDISYPKRIEEQVNYLKKHPDLVGIGTLVKYFTDHPKLPIKKLKIGEKRNNYFQSRESIRNQMIFGSPVIHSSMMFSKEVFMEVGGYNPDYTITYDHELWLKLLEKGDIEKVPKVLLNYRVNPSSLAHRNNYKTSNEIQVTSSRAIQRNLKRRGISSPKIIVIGSKEGVNNYKSNIAIHSGMTVTKSIDVLSDWKSKAKRAVKSVSKGHVDSIIVLGEKKSERIIDYLESNGLQLNKNLYYIFSMNFFK